MNRNGAVSIWKRDLFWALLFIVASIFLRFFSFFPSELDHDESTYAIIGNEILHGKKLYSDVTDTKPVGIFLVYAGLQYLVGYSIFMKRLFATLIVAITCYFVRKVSLQMFLNHPAANAAAIIYLFYTSMWGIFGLSPNTELYFNLFTILSLQFLLRKNNTGFFFAGLMAGIGFMFKYLVLFDYAAFVLFYFILDIQSKRVSVNRVKRYAVSAFGFGLPFLITSIYFISQGRFSDFYFISFVVPGNYIGSPSVVRYLTMLGDLLLRFLPFTFFFLVVLFKRQSLLLRKQLLFFLLWIAFVLLAMYLPGKEFSHYNIQLMLPLSLLAGMYFHSNNKMNTISNFLFRRKSGLIFWFIIVLVIQIASYSDNIARPDYQRQVAGYLEQNMSNEDAVFVSNYEPIIYYLLKQDSPTKYVHSNILFTDLHKAFNFDNIEEVTRIMRMEPKFVLVQYENEIVEPMLSEAYVLDTMFRNNEIFVYKLK